MNLTALPDGRAARYPQTVAYTDRRNGELKNTQRPQRVQVVADRLSNGACAPRGSMARFRPAHARYGTSTHSVPLNRSAIDAGQSAAAPATDPDHRQADYFLRLLTQNCARIDRQIGQYQKVIAIAETRGAVDYGRRLRQMMRIEEQERQTVEGLIDRLQRRFPLAPLG